MPRYFQVQEFSKLTGVTIRTLHYWDQISILKPSIKKTNGHRFYSEDDIYKLEQITSLKFMGFTLKDIKRLLSAKVQSPLQMFKLQVEFFEEKMAGLNKAHKLLIEIVKLLEKDGNIDFDKLLKLQKVFTMTENLKQTWAGKILNEDEIREWAELGQSYSKEQMDAYHKKWEPLTVEIEALDFTDKVKAQDIARRCRALFEEGYSGASQGLREGIRTAYTTDQISTDVVPSKMQEFLKSMMNGEFD